MGYQCTFVASLLRKGYDTCIAMAQPKVSTSILIGSLRSKQYSRGAIMKASFSQLNIAYLWDPYLKLLPIPLVRLVNGPIIFEYLTMKCRQKFTKPRKVMSSFTFLGYGYSCIVATCSYSIDILSYPTSNPRNRTLSVLNSHFLRLVYRPYSYSLLKTVFICSSCYRSSIEQIRILSR